jgi:3-oxoacyl-[acyl-carrier protein] reductase
MTRRRLSMIEKWALAHDAVSMKLSRPSDAGRYQPLRESEDIADLMAFLVSPAARWLTGTQVRIDCSEVDVILAPSIAYSSQCEI